MEYAGNHSALVDTDTWQRVQDILASHINGERTREHPHFLKGSLYCHSCGSRMIINYTKSRSGVRYPYFVCGGRHNKVTNCKQKAVLIDVVERQVEQIYDNFSYPPAVREHLEKFLQDSLKTEQQKYETELDGLRREKGKLEHQRRKLLDAHYNNAISLDLMRSEQQRITKQLAAIESQVKTYEYTFENLAERLSEALELVEDCGRTYRIVDDHIKKMLNQAIFSKLWVESDGRVTAEFRAPFNILAAPLADVIIRCSKEKARDTAKTAVLTDIFSVISNHLQKFFGGGWSNDFMVEPTLKQSNLFSVSAHF